jgi:hypothetical protein
MAAAIIVQEITALPLRWPTVSDADRAKNEAARARLLAEPD